MVKQMIKRKFLWLAAAALIAPLTVPFAAYSAELKISFQDPEHFSDMEAARENREKFRERTLEGLQEIFTELANTLPDDQVLDITVTDVNLAGYVDQVQRNGGMQPLRVVRQGHSPTISLEYVLYDADGNVLKEDEERLRGRDAGDQTRGGSRADQVSLRHERDMLERWFKRTFED